MTSYLHYILEKKHKNVFSYLLKLQMEGFFPSFLSIRSAGTKAYTAYILGIFTLTIICVL